MEKKINIAELLKDCPSGMELDCKMYDDIFFYEITDDPTFPIRIKRIDGLPITLTKYGEYSNCPSSKCVIFPKGKTTWEGFKPPCKFKDGDIVVNATNEDSNAFVYAGEDDNHYYSYVGLYAGINPGLCTNKSRCWVPKKLGIRFASEEEKQKLFDAIKANGYKWNAETKTLEKLVIPKFKVWDKVLINDDENNVYMVKSMVWNEEFNRVVYKIEAVEGTMDKHDCFAHEMVFFNHKKEETMEERKYADLRQGLDQYDKLATEATIDGDKITPPDNYLIGKITKVDNGMLVEFVKKQPQYPKTYEECCAIIGEFNSNTLKWNNPFCINRDTHPYIKHLDNLIESFYKLLICRQAYWKIAGEQMGLREPWEPEFRFGKKKYCIMTKDNKVIKATVEETNRILAFPTEEMRDAFFEYFKDLIESCKELL